MRTPTDSDTDSRTQALGGLKNGFRLFATPPGTPVFGLDEIQAASDVDDFEMRCFFPSPASRADLE